DAHVRAAGPLVTRQRPLRRDRGVDGVSRTPERDEERVALAVELAAAARRPGLPEQALVVGDHLAVPVAELAEESGRSLDVAEEEGECLGRALVQAHVTRSLARRRSRGGPLPSGASPRARRGPSARRRAAPRAASPGRARASGAPPRPGRSSR